MGKQDRRDGNKADLIDIDPEKSRECPCEQTIDSVRNAMTKEEKEKLVEVLKDWLRE